MVQASIPDMLRRRLDRFTRPGVPKYVALRDALADAIASGDWPENTRLPTEIEYAAALPLSLGTIQRALRALADEGLITRQQGHGSFVAANGAARMHAPLHCRFVNDAGTGYLPVYPEVLRRYEEAREGPWSRHLGSASILCIERALRIGDEFRVFSRFWCDPTRLPALSTLPFGKLSGENFKDIVWRETRQLVGRISTYLSTAALPPDACRAIGARRGSRGQLLEISAYLGRDQPIYYQELHIPPNRRRLHLAADGRDSGVGGKS
jgi:DNA-binding GntR family transcriptional regulator